MLADEGRCQGSGVANQSGEQRADLDTPLGSWYKGKKYSCTRSSSLARAPGVAL
jgi:hypothetical protein